MTTTRQLTAAADHGLWFRDHHGPPSKKGPGTDPGDQTDTLRDNPLICAHCSAPVTTEALAISIDDKHEHTFFNPAGIVYTLRLFRRAPGAVIHGDPSTEFSWFSGHTWQFALCGNCLNHLGWYFSSADASFFGLIKSRLI